MKKQLFILFISLFLIICKGFSQNTETQQPYKSPKKATIYSAVLPGMGQAYNSFKGYNKYWKIPIIYGIGGFLTYNYIQFNKSYACHRDAINDVSSKFNCDTYQLANLSDSQLRDRKNIAKHNRDLQIILLLAIYVVNIVDANVDAHLSEFELGDKTSASITPNLNTFQLYGKERGVLGLNFNLTF